MANIKQQLETPAVNPLAFAPVIYDQHHQNENYGLLNNYFRKLILALGSLFKNQGGKFLNNPHGSFSDTTNQTAASITASYPIRFNTVDFNNGVSVASGSRITVSVDGVFNIQFSIQLENTVNAPQDVNIFFRKNGVDIPNSNSRYGMAPRKTSTNFFHVIMAVNFFCSLDAGDYIEIVWTTSDLGVFIASYPATTNPTRPVTPSAIATVSFVSNL